MILVLSDEIQRNAESKKRIRAGSYVSPAASKVVSYPTSWHRALKYRFCRNSHEIMC